MDLFVLNVQPCSLASGCMPLERVKESGLLVSMPAVSQNLGNYETPIKKYLSSDVYYQINENMVQRYDIKVVENEIVDDLGMFRGKQTRVKYPSFDKTYTMTPIQP